MANGRLAFRVSEVCELAGVSRWAVERAIKQNRIRTKRAGRVLLLHPNDVREQFGFDGPQEVCEPSAESIAEIEELLA